ncbi:MAG: hypothetical protein ABW310_01890 [Acidimicrobiales bacterium]
MISTLVRNRRRVRSSMMTFELDTMRPTPPDDPSVAVGQGRPAAVDVVAVVADQRGEGAADPSLHDTIDPRTSRTPKADVLRRSFPLIGPSSRTWSSGVPWSPKYGNINVVTLLSLVSPGG